MRTGAASAIATKHLSRPDSRVLGIIGAGVQAQHQLRATLAVRADPQRPRLESVRRAPGVAWAALARELGLAFTAESSCEAVASKADVLITVTPSQQSLVEAAWVRPGTHINAMGADTRGKQELDRVLVAAAPPCSSTKPRRP